MARSFDEVNSLYTGAKSQGLFKDLDIRQFSNLLNTATGSKDFEAGNVGSFGKHVKLTSGAIDELLDFSGANQQAANLGGTIGAFLGDRDTGYNVGRTLPRATVNLLPAAFGPAGIATAAALSSSDVYNQTGELDRALFAGATSAAAPLVIGKMLPAIAGAVPGGAALGEVLTRSTAGGVAARFAGNLAEGGVYGLGQDLGDIALAEDRSFSELKSKQYWVEQGVGALAFAPFDLKQAFDAQLSAGRSTSPEQLGDTNRAAIDKSIKDPYVAPEEPEIVLGKEPVVKDQVQQEVGLDDIIPPPSGDELLPGVDESVEVPFKPEPGLMGEAPPKEVVVKEDVATPVVLPEVAPDALPFLANEPVKVMADEVALKIDEIVEKVPETVEEVKAQLGVVNEVRTTLDEPVISNEDVTALVEKHLARGEDVTESVNRSVQEIKNKTTEKVKKVKETSQEPVFVEPSKAALFDKVKEVWADDEPKAKKAHDKIMKLITEHKGDARVVDSLADQFGQWYGTFQEHGVGNFAALDSRIKKVREQARRLGKAEVAGTEAPKSKGRKKKLGEQEVLHAFDRVDVLEPELKKQVMDSYNHYVRRASQGMTHEVDVQAKGVNVLDDWLNKGGTNIEQLKGLLGKAEQKVYLEAKSEAKRRGLVSDDDGVFTDREIGEGFSLRMEQEDELGGFDAMKLRAAENLSLYWNTPQYSVQPNGQVKFGKLLSGKDGKVPLKAVEQTAGFNGKQLKKGEIALWKELVPEAFMGESVDLNVLVKGLEDSEPVVEEKVLGDSNNEVDQLHTQRGQLVHEMETRGLPPVERGPDGELYYEDSMGAPVPYQLTHTPEEVALAERYLALEEQMTEAGAFNKGNNNAAKYGWLGPKPEQDMPGYVEGLVRLPSKFNYDARRPDGTLKNEREQGLKFSGPHFGEHDKNVVAFYRGYEEVLPSGEKVFHVVEVQSDWAQQNQKLRQKAKESKDSMVEDRLSQQDHELLAVYESLALKAAIQHAQKIGATKIALSDAETAMMTEGHDRTGESMYNYRTDENSKGGFDVIKTTTGEKLQSFVSLAEADAFLASLPPTRPTQEAGMRLHYDQTLPRELERLTGTKGEEVEFGLHREAILTDGNQAPRADEFPDPVTGLYQINVLGIKGSPAFNNKTQVTAKLYPLSNLSLSTQFLFGNNGMRALTDTEVANKVLLNRGETPTNAAVLTPHVVRIADVFKNLTGEDVSIGTILNDPTMLGLASQKHTAVWLNASNPKHLSGIVAAHEILGHTLNQLYLGGKLGPKEHLHYDRLQSEWGKALPAERGSTIETLANELLPKSVREEFLNTALKELQSEGESLSNLTALLAYGLNTKADLRESFRYLPQPLVDVFIDMMRFLRRTLGAVKSTLGYSFLQGKVPSVAMENIRAFDNLLGKSFDSVAREQEQAALFMQRIDQITPGGYSRFRDAGELDASLLTQGADGSFRGVQNAAYDAFMKRKDVSDFAEPTLHMMERYPALRYLSNVFRGEAGTAHAIMRQNEVILFTDGYHKSGRPKVAKDGGAVLKAIKDPKVFARIDELLLDQNELKFSILDHPPGHPQREQYLNDLTPEQQTNLLDTVSRIQEATRVTQANIIDSHHRQAKNELCKLVRKSMPGTNDEIRLAVDALYDSYRLGRSTQDFTVFNQMIQAYGVKNASLTSWLDNTINNIAKTEATFGKKPYFVTERRMKRYHVVYDKKDGTPTGRVDFDTPEQAQAYVKEAQGKGYAMVYEQGGYKDMWSRHGGNAKSYDLFEQQMAAAENKSLIPLYDRMLQSGEIDQAVYEDLLKSRKAFRYALSNEHIDATLGNAQPNRKFREGRQDLNMLEQHMRYTQKLARSLVRAETDGAVAFERMNPALVNDPAAWHAFEQGIKHLEGFRRPDTDLGRKMTKGIFSYYILGNVSSALIEATQAPLNLVPKLVAEGSSIAGAYAAPFNAASKIAQQNMSGKWDSGITVTAGGRKTDAYQMLINRAESEGFLGMGLQQELRDMDYQTMLDLGNMSAGKDAKGKGHLTTMAGAMMNVAQKFYGSFAAYNEKISYLASFDLKKQQLFGDKKVLTGREFEQVYQEALRVTSIANSNAGRIGRPQGWFDNQGAWRTTAQMMYSLGSYNAGALSNLWTYLRQGFGKDIKGLSPQQKSQARKASLLAFSSLIGAAGLIGGIPFAGPMVALLDEHTDLEVEKNIRLAAFKLGEEINGQEGGTFVADAATHGFAYAMGLPMDISSRIAMNGIMGFNAYEGWSTKALLGPIGGIGQAASDTLSNVLQGDITQGIESALPPAFKRLWSLAANNGAVTDRKGKTLYLPTHGEQTLMAMGFQPRNIAQMREAQRLQYKGDRVRQDSNERLHRNVAEVAKTDPGKARQMLEVYAQENPGYSKAAGVSSVVDYLTRGKFGYDPTREGNAQAGLDNKGILDSFGGGEAFRTTPEVDYFTERTKQKARLGAPLGDVREGLLQSLLTDRLIQSKGLPVPAARAVAGALSGRVTEQSHPLLEAFL